MEAKQIAIVLALVAGAVVGIWHLQLASASIFVFREGEPATSWLAVMLGPGFTLVGTVIAAWNRPIGGLLLIVAAAIASIALGIGDGPAYGNVLPFLIRVTVPMVAVGATCLGLASRMKKESHAT